MSASFKIKSILFDPSVQEETRKQWLESRHFSSKFGNTKSLKQKDELVLYKQHNVKGDGQVMRIKLEEGIWADAQMRSVKYKSKRPKKQQDESVVDQKAE